MRVDEFNVIVESRIEKTRNLLIKKGVEYAGDGDRLYNFKRAAEILRTTPELALWGMFCKHLVSVIDMVEGRHQVTDKMIDEKIGDMITYLHILEAYFKEKKLCNRNLTSGLKRLSSELKMPNKNAVR
jgi:hypothetical protein